MYELLKCCVEHRPLINSRHHRKHMCFRQELIKRRSSPLHRCSAQFRFSGQLMLHFNPMVMSTKRSESRNCAYHHRSQWRALTLDGQCRQPYNSPLHRNHMVFGPELLGRRHSPHHSTWVLNHMLLQYWTTCRIELCCGERQRLINSRHHRNYICFGQELIKSRSSPLHYGANTQADTQAIHIRLCIDSTIQDNVVKSADVSLILSSIENTRHLVQN
jgi:hypothetical protein